MRGPRYLCLGHVHGRVLDFRGTTLLFQHMAGPNFHQRMLGFQPKPCMLTIINLKSHKSISIPFA